MRGPVDTASGIVAGVLRPIYATAAAFMVCTALGTPLGLLALAGDGRMPWLAVAILAPISLSLAWFSERVRKKYLRYVRIAADESA